MSNYMQLFFHIFLLLFALSFCSLLFYHTHRIFILIETLLKSFLEEKEKKEEHYPPTEIVERDIDKKTQWEEEDLD